MDGTAAGKIILFGEHAVVHGGDAMVCGLDRGVRAVATPTCVVVASHDREPPDGDGDADTDPGTSAIEADAQSATEKAEEGHDTDDRDYSQGFAEEPELVLIMGNASLSVRPTPTSDVGRAFSSWLAATNQRARVEATFEIPTRAGLGSSAALAVAVLRSLGANEAEVAEGALESERIFHGMPSGIDTEAARRGTLGLYGRKNGWRDLVAPPLEICVGFTGKTRNTRDTVGHVAKLVDEAPKLARELFGNISFIVTSALEALAHGDLVAVGRLMTANHGLLAGLGTSTVELDAMCHLARGAGALGAKLTGAGGGGAVIALCPSRQQEVLAAWRASGYDGFHTTVPCTR